MKRETSHEINEISVKRARFSQIVGRYAHRMLPSGTPNWMMCWPASEKTGLI